MDEVNSLIWQCLVFLSNQSVPLDHPENLVFQYIYILGTAISTVVLVHTRIEGRATR